jgi:hypothetical protein
VSSRDRILELNAQMDEALIGQEAVIERLPESFFIPEWDEPERGAGSIRATNTTFRGLPRCPPQVRGEPGSWAARHPHHACAVACAERIETAGHSTVPTPDKTGGIPPRRISHPLKPIAPRRRCRIAATQPNESPKRVLVVRKLRPNDDA